MSDVYHEVLETLVREGRADHQTIEIASQILNIVHADLCRHWNGEPRLESVCYSVEQLKDAYHELHRIAITQEQKGRT